MWGMTPPAEQRLSPLQSRVAREIVAIVRREDKQAGEHLAESLLAEQVGTSRSPVQVALRHLVAHGVLQQDPNRGYFLARDAKDWGVVAEQFSSQPDDPLYLAIAEARQTGQLPDEVNEAELMRRFNVARSTLRKVLTRISEEGWVEPKVGHGWSFQNMIESPEAYEESYLFRQAIEPTIGHMKTDGLLARNWLKGSDGDAIHAVLCGAGHNLRLILAHLRVLLLALIVLARYATNMLSSVCGRAAATLNEGLGGAMPTARARRWA